MVRQGSAKPSFGGSIPPAASSLPIAALAAAVLVATAISAAAAVLPFQTHQEPGAQPWPQDWLSDIPLVDLSGTWVFDPQGSDPMLEPWRDREVRYEIGQHPAHIVLEFRVEGGRSNTQTYRWDGTVHRFQRDVRNVEEAARWTRGGRKLEVRGRHWDPETPDEIVEYSFSYERRGPVLTFIQGNATGTTVWRFVLERD